MEISLMRSAVLDDDDLGDYLTPFSHRFFDVPPSCLPEVKSSSEHYGNVDEGLPLAGIPISGVRKFRVSERERESRIITLPNRLNNLYESVWVISRLL